jgi:hypothetical protein
MRRFSALALLSAAAFLPAMVSPAAAQDQPKDDQPPAHHARQTWEEHFTRANLAHDGHLTLSEAKLGYPTISRHFQAIDVDGKGFVTENDLRAWKALQKTARQQPKEPEDMLRPRNAFHLSYPDKRPMDTKADHIVALPSDALRSGDTLPDPE